MTIEELQQPGPARSAGLDAATGALKMNVGLCGDRCRAAAVATVDAFLNAAAAEERRNQPQGEDWARYPVSGRRPS